MSYPSLQQQNGDPEGRASSNSMTLASSHKTGVKRRFRRQRARQVCEVRCDGVNLGFPCTNCVAFGVECHIYTPKRNKGTLCTETFANLGIEKFRDRRSGSEDQTNRPNSTAIPAPLARDAASPRSSSDTIRCEQTDEQNKDDSQTLSNSGFGTNLSITRAPLSEPGKVAFLGESSNLSFLIGDGQSPVVHYPLSGHAKGHRARLAKLDQVEISILNYRGAFLLPPRALCDDIFEAYFEWVHPIMPVLDRAQFMKQYHDPENPPSLLLLQAMLLAGSRVCTNPQLTDANGSTLPAALKLYGRAKALYDASYEDNRVTIVQALLLMGWYWDGPANSIHNAFHWTRIAITVAQAAGMHRSVEQSRLSVSDKKLWKRLWWTLVTRDRVLAASFGRPVQIRLDGCDVEDLTEVDFTGSSDSEIDVGCEADSVQVTFFLQYVKLCRILDGVLSHHYSITSIRQQYNAAHMAQSDTELSRWLAACPETVSWKPQSHNFWAAVLHSYYSTVLCLLYRTHMLPGREVPKEWTNHSRKVTFHASSMISSILEVLSTHAQLRFCPAFIVYSILSALVILVNQIRSSAPSILREAQSRLITCLQALREVSKTWPTGKLVSSLFEGMIGEQGPGEGARQTCNDAGAALQQNPSGISHSCKRKDDEMNPDSNTNGHMSSEFHEGLAPLTSDGNTNPSMAAPLHLSMIPEDAFLGYSSFRPQSLPVPTTNPCWSAPTPPSDICLTDSNSLDVWQFKAEDFYKGEQFLDGSSMPVLPNSLINETAQTLEQHNLTPEDSAPSSVPTVLQSQRRQYAHRFKKAENPVQSGPLHQGQTSHAAAMWPYQRQSEPTAAMLADWYIEMSINQPLSTGTNM